MTTAAQTLVGTKGRPDHLSGTSRAGTIDRWIYVFTAVSFVVVALLGFIPDSLNKVAAVQAGQRPPFPLVLHLHAVLMGTFLLLLLTQTLLVAMGRSARHRQLGLAAIVVAAALVVVGFILVPTMYHALWNAAQMAPPQARPGLQQTLRGAENIMLLQTRIGLLFSLLLFIGLRARVADPGLHKRMMILAVAIALPAGFDRIAWLPTTLPFSPLSPDLYVLLAVAPMFVWDVIRNRSVHPAYWIWLAVALPFAIAVHTLWDRPWWHATARQLMGV
jgi:hypothetical protein